MTKSPEYLEFTDSPNKEWSIGSGASNDEWKSIPKLSVEPDPTKNYRTLIGAITPRPVAFISTISEDGDLNVAPFSFFNVMGSDPPLFSVSITSDGKEKDTTANIVKTKELTINIISEWFIEAANYASINTPKGISEWDLSGLTTAKSDVVKPPIAAESAFSVEAKLVHHHQFPSKTIPGKITNILIVEGVKFHIREDLYDKESGVVDTAKLVPISRLGGISYGKLSQRYNLPRPQYSEESQK